METVFSALARSMSLQTTLAPSVANLIAVAPPRPPPAPVTKAILDPSRISFSYLRAGFI